MIEGAPLERERRGGITPTRRALTIAFALAPVAALPLVADGRLWPLWPLATTALLFAVLLDAILALSPHRLELRLATPAMLGVGVPTAAALQVVALRTRRRVSLELACDLSPELDTLGVLAVEGVGAAPSSVELPLVARRRGEGRIERIWVRYEGPLGLARRTAVFRAERDLPIAPDLAHVRAAAIRFHSDRDFRAGLKVERYAGDGTQFDAMRDYVPGLDTRSIDWKSTARHCRLVCREFRAERNHQVVLAIDTGHLMAERLEGLPKLDHAIHASLLLAYVALRTGDRVGLFTFDTKAGMYAAPQGGIHTHLSLVKLTSQIRYATVETNFTLGLTTLARRIQRRSLILVLTDFVDAVSAEMMVEPLLLTGRRHLVMLAALRDPLLEQASWTAPRDGLDLGRAVVAGRFLRDRELVLRRLERGGVRCIDVRPRDLGTAVISDYLDIKRRERIA